MEPVPRYWVIANYEDEYAVWPAVRPLPPPWRRVGITGTMEVCMSYIRRIETASAVTVRATVEHESIRP